MLDRLGIAKEQLRQIKMILDDNAQKLEKGFISKAEYHRMVDFMLDNIKEVMNRIERLESENR